jgi:hypothetical protein
VETEPQESFRPAVGDLVLIGHAEGNTASCGVVLRVNEDLVGSRLYFVQMNRALLLNRGPERLTQDEFDTLGFHSSTDEEWQEDMRGAEEWYEAEKAKLYEAIEPYVSSAGKSADVDQKQVGEQSPAC